MMRTCCALAIILAASICSVQSACSLPYLKDLSPKLCVWEWATNYNAARGVLVDANHTVLIVETGTGSIRGNYDANDDGVIESGETWPVATQAGLNHALTIHEGHLYASTADSIYRWAYTPGSRTTLPAPQTVMTGLPNTHHVTHALVFDMKGALFVGIGSGSNVDPDSSRARVVRCALDFSASAIPASGYAYSQALCPAWADGTRNEVGLALDPLGRLWGVENGVDELERADLGGDIHQTNPGEEINLFVKPGFYGYPYCWSEYQLASDHSEGPMSQWAHPQFIGDGTHTDAWCKDQANVIKPVAVMPAHVAPLDLLFHHSPSFPPPFNTGLFVGQHGSWDADPMTGYAVVHFELDKNFSILPNSSTTLFSVASPDNSGFRPVALAKLSPCGPHAECLLVTSDALGTVVAVAAGP